MNEEWVVFGDKFPPSDALIIYYMPLARYVWGCGLDYQQIKSEYPAVTHWKIATMAPPELPGPDKTVRPD